MNAQPSIPPKAANVTRCCAPFDPEPWQDRELVWNDKPFVKEHVHSVLHVPLDMARVVRRTEARVAAVHARAPDELRLADETSPWGADLYFEVTRPVPGAEMANFSGTFVTRVCEGPFREAPRWAREFEAELSRHGRKVSKLYFHYTTCPKCAKAYGKNYVVLFARIAPGIGAVA